MGLCRHMRQKGPTPEHVPLSLARTTQLRRPPPAHPAHWTPLLRAGLLGHAMPPASSTSPFEPAAPNPPLNHIHTPSQTPPPFLQVSLAPPYPVDDANFKKLVAILRIAVPYTGMILSTR